MFTLTHVLLRFAASKVKQSARQRDHTAVPFRQHWCYQFSASSHAHHFIAHLNSRPFVLLKNSFSVFLAGFNFKLQTSQMELEAKKVNTTECQIFVRNPSWTGRWNITDFFVLVNRVYIVHCALFCHSNFSWLCQSMWLFCFNLWYF